LLGPALGAPLGDAKFSELSVWEGFFGRRAKFEVFQAIADVIVWLLWMERNRRVFVGVETSLEWLKDK